MEEISFRRLTREDLPLVFEWLNREHVKRWWRDALTFTDVEAKYGPRIDGHEKTDMYVIEIGGAPSGLIQTYLVSDHPEWIGDEPGVAGIDLFIGEEDLIGRGLGPRVLTEFTNRVVFVDPAVSACVAAPEVINDRSLRAFEKAGFVRERELPGEWGPELLMRKERSE
jgi:RimJ/RimL family protein N-acetyltransferase